MITLTYTILLNNPEDTFFNRYRHFAVRHNTCIDEYLEGDDIIGCKVLELSVDGNSVRLHGVSNPLTQYKNLGILEKSGS